MDFAAIRTTSDEIRIDSMAKKLSSSFPTCTNYAWIEPERCDEDYKQTKGKSSSKPQQSDSRAPSRRSLNRARRCPRATSTSPMTSGTYSATSRPPKSDQNLTTPCLCIQARNKGSAPRNEVQEAPSPRSGSHARSDYIRSNARSDSGNTSPSGTD